MKTLNAVLGIMLILFSHFQSVKADVKLNNKKGQPANPFRTEDWSGIIK